MIRDDISLWLQELILRCLEVDAKARHAPAGQLAFDLQHPDAIVLTESAERRKRSSLLRVATRYDLAARGGRSSCRPVRISSPVRLCWRRWIWATGRSP